MSADIGGIIDRLVAAKVILKKAQDVVKSAEEDIDKIKLEFRDAIGLVGLAEGRNKTHSASVVEKVVPQVTAWDDFLAYVDSTKYFHLLQRRPSTPGCVELWEAGQVIPGCEQFKKVDVSLRSL